MTAKIVCFVTFFCAFCVHRIVEASRNELDAILEGKTTDRSSINAITEKADDQGTIGVLTESADDMVRFFRTRGDGSPANTLVPLIDETMDIEPSSGLKLKFSDIPEGSEDSLWKTLIAGSGETVTESGGKPGTVKVRGTSGGASSSMVMSTKSSVVSDFEGSGDWNDTWWLTTETSVATQTTAVTEKETALPSLCFERRCNSSELDVPRALKLPQASDVTVSCMSYGMSSSSLFWYLANDSQLVLMDSAIESEINLTLERALVLDSGVYKCVKLSETSCCYLDFELRIYEMPNYENHMLIVGIVAVVLLVVCLILVVCRNRRNERRFRKARYSNGTTHELLSPS